MGADTKIEWCHHSWSPWHGCEKVSPGCKHCYAEAGSVRNPGVLGVWGANGTRVVSKSWDKPLAWDRAAARAGERRRVFPSLCDVFEDRPELVESRVRLFELIERTPNLDWLLLTKRPENVNRMLPWCGEHDGEYRGPCWDNVWVGASVEDQQRADERIPLLLQVFASVRFLSCEPLLGSVNLRDSLGRRCLVCNEPTPGQWWHEHDDGLHKMPCIEGVSWVIVGGESGPNARPCDVAWVRSIVDQCREADIPAFVKQLGACPVATPVPGYTTGLPKLRDPKGGNVDEFPQDLRVREFPHRAGALAR